MHANDVPLTKRLQTTRKVAKELGVVLKERPMAPAPKGLQ
jgi:hypothetical protein